jgi:hypothetical protein
MPQTPAEVSPFEFPAAPVRPAFGMDAETSKALAAFGFLTVLESREHGAFGGYLVLSPQGRPLEFRCSAPIMPSRAQEILYGPTLRSYLFTDVIGQSLLASSQLPVRLVLTDQWDMLPLAWLRKEIVLHIAVIDDSSPTGASGAIVAPASGELAFPFAGCVVTSAALQPDANSLRELLEPLAAHVFLTEPFDRIRAALVEAQLDLEETAEPCHDRSAA